VPVGDFCSVDGRGNPTSSKSDDIDQGPGHGTLNASIAAGFRSGVAKGAAVYALRAFCYTSSRWHGTSEAIQNAVEWITAHGRKPAVVNISFGPGWPDRSINTRLRAAILSSIGAGFVYVLSQACQPDVDKLWSRDVATRALVAGSVDTGDVADGRDYGADLAMFAPAPGVVGAIKASDSSYDDYGQVDNRCADSHAAPHVAGVAARYLELHPSATPATVRAELVNHATAGALSNVYSGTPNRLLYSGFLDGPLRSHGASRHAWRTKEKGPRFCAALSGSTKVSQAYAFDLPFRRRRPTIATPVPKSTSEPGSGACAGSNGVTTPPRTVNR
jgi:subtilisin family serine protease